MILYEDYLNGICKLRKRSSLCFKNVKNFNFLLFYEDMKLKNFKNKILILLEIKKKIAYIVLNKLFTEYSLEQTRVRH
jgi:hypothetical protein